MNKYAIVLGAAAAAVIAGCKDPDYKYGNSQSSQSDVKSVDTTPAAVPRAIEIQPARRCTCAPGMKHDKPCACGAADCMCVYEPKPVVTADLSAKPAPAAVPAAPAPEVTTTYIVQNGDYLSKISKKFNVTISAIKKLNPSINAKNVVRVGQKIKLPGKIDVGVQAEPAKPAVRAAGKKAYAPYSGATKEYVVKSGDTLGGIAYSNGINIRQLKELNGLKKDVLRVGQKLKIPAEKVVAAKPAVAAPAAAKPVAAPAAAPAPAPAAVAAPEAAPVAAPEAAPAAAPEAAPVSEAAAPAADAGATTTYIVQEGDDMTGVSIRWGVSAAVIRELNNLGDKDQLVPGQILKLPADAQQ